MDSLKEGAKPTNEALCLYRTLAIQCYFLA